MLLTLPNVTIDLDAKTVTFNETGDYYIEFIEMPGWSGNPVTVNAAGTSWEVRVGFAINIENNPQYPQNASGYRCFNWISENNYSFRLYNGPSKDCPYIPIHFVTQAAPTSVVPANETVQGLGDGTLTGVTDLMEYQKQNADGTTWPDTWTAVPTGKNVVTGLAPGVYRVRYKQYVADYDTTYMCSDPTADITITAGVAPTYAISVADVTISGAKHGYNPDDFATTIVITNGAGANAPVTIGGVNDGVYLQGTNPDMFIIEGSGGTVPLDGSLETLTISPNGVLDVNTYTADIYVSNDDGASDTATVTFTVSKGDHTFVMPPQVSINGTKSLTVSGTSGQKYLVRLTSATAPTSADPDWTNGTAKVGDGNALVLDGLEPSTAYTVYTFMPGNENYNASGVKSTDTFTLPEAPSADSVINETNGITLDYAAETVTVHGATYEVYVPSPPSTTPPSGTVTTTSGDCASASISGAIPNAGASGNLYVRQKAAGSIPASAWAAVPLTARPAAPAGEELPAAPGNSDVTDTSITIAVKNGYEYILDTNASAPTALDWASIGSPYHKAAADGTHTFSDLTAGTTYYVHVRKAATGGAGLLDSRDHGSDHDQANPKRARRADRERTDDEQHNPERHGQRAAVYRAAEGHNAVLRRLG